MLTFLTKLRFTRDRCYVPGDDELVDDDNDDEEMEEDGRQEDEERRESLGSFQ